MYDKSVVTHFGDKPVPAINARDVYHGNNPTIDWEEEQKNQVPARRSRMPMIKQNLTNLNVVNTEINMFICKQGRGAFDAPPSVSPRSRPAQFTQPGPCYSVLFVPEPKQ